MLRREIYARTLGIDHAELSYTFNSLSPFSALMPHAACCRGVHSITLEIETADHDHPVARYSSTFHQLIYRKVRPMCFPSLRVLRFIHYVIH